MKNLSSICYLIFCSLFQINAQQWHKLETTNSCIKRHENSAVAVGNTIVLLGGRGIKPVETFDLKSTTWTKHINTPLEFNHFQAIAYHGEVWVLGAFMGSYPHEKPIDHIYIFNIKKNEWRIGAKIPEDRLRGSAGIAVYNDKIYMVSGIQDGHWDGHVTWFDEYDPKTDTWTKLAETPRARDHFSAVIYKDKLYVAGGRRSQARTNQVMKIPEPIVDIYDFKTKSWSSLPESSNLPTVRAGTMAVIMKNKLLIIGGESESQVPAHSETEALDLKTLKWEKLPNMLEGRHGTGIAKIKNKVYIIAGSGNRGGGPELNTVEVLK